MGRNSIFITGIVLTLMISLECVSCPFYSQIPTTNYEYIVRADLGDLLRDMSECNQDSLFNAAIKQADSLSNAGTGNFMDEMSKIYSPKNTEGQLAPIFASVPWYSMDIHRTDPNKKVLEYLNKPLREELYKVFVTLKTRVCQFDTTPDMQIDYTKGIITINVTVSNSGDPLRLRKIMQTQGKLELWDMYENEELIDDLIEADRALAKWKKVKDEPEPDPDARIPVKDHPDLSVPVLVLQGDSLVAMSPEKDTLIPLLKILYPMADSKNGAYPGPRIGLSYARDTAKVNRYLAMDIVRANFPKDVRFIWGEKPLNDNKLYELFAIKINPSRSGPPLNGDVITDARQSFYQNDQPILTLTMNTSGAVKWEKMTDEAANSQIMVEGRSKVIKRCVAIVLDDRVFSAPRVQSRIAGGIMEITGTGDVSETADLANILKSGAIKCRVRVVYENLLRNANGK
jgi:SecD/SecF fusion protein